MSVWPEKSNNLKDFTRELIWRRGVLLLDGSAVGLLLEVENKLIVSDKCSKRNFNHSFAFVQQT